METIGKYRIEEKIGSGGFGEVFKGYDPLIKRHVAIKVCGSDDQDIAERFSREAEIGGNLHHRNITTVYDFGVHDHRPYLVQEYLTGEDLDVKIKRREYLPYSEKLLYLLQIARGLGHAHSRGVIHRDVKPANVRILEDGTAKIMDFGIAKLAQHESGLTQTGMTLGTAAYLAPEQVRGDAVDLRTDVFSFGVLAYELITYQRPFLGEEISTVLYNLMHREPEPLTAHWPGAPSGLVALIDRCMRKDAGQRFADGSGLVQELEQLKQSGSGTRQVETPAGGIAVESAAAPPDAAVATRVLVAGDEAPDRDRHTVAIQGASGLEYRQSPDRPATDTLVATARSARPGRWPKAGVVAMWLVLATLAGGGGWWLGTRGQVGGDGTTPESAGDPAAGDPAAAGDAAATTPATPTEVEPSSSDAVVPLPEAEPQATAAAETQPPPPATGRLNLPRVPWTDLMTARVAGRSYPLHRTWEIELAPGTYSAVFELDADDYAPASRTVEVSVDAGKSSSIDVPIPRPGALSVRPLPGRAQGRVTIDGEPLGATPLSGVRREPGIYQLEILPRGSDEGLEAEVTLESGRELILSFDLAAGTLEARTKP